MSLLYLARPQLVDLPSTLALTMLESGKRPQAVRLLEENEPAPAGSVAIISWPTLDWCVRILSADTPKEKAFCLGHAWLAKAAYVVAIRQPHSTSAGRFKKYVRRVPVIIDRIAYEHAGIQRIRIA